MMSLDRKYQIKYYVDLETGWGTDDNDGKGYDFITVGQKKYDEYFKKDYICFTEVFDGGEEK